MLNIDYKVVKHGKFHNPASESIVQCPECSFKFDSDWKTNKKGDVTICTACQCEFIIKEREWVI